MKKILRIITRLNVGGPTVHVALLAQQLVSYGYHTLLVHGQTMNGEQEMDWLFTSSAIERQRLPAMVRPVRPGDDWRTLISLRQIMRTFRPHIVHTHQAKAGLLGRLAAHLEKVPVVIHTYHGLNFQGHFHPLFARFSISLERYLARLSTRLIAISPQIAHDLQRTYRVGRRGQIVLVPLGIPLEHLLCCETKRQSFRESLQHRYHLPAQAILVGFAGRLTHVKYPQLFLEAARLIRQQCTQVWFVVAGEGELKEALRQQAQQQGLGPYCIFLGDVSAMDTFYGGIDILMLTSRSEGTPLTIIEALAAAKPVVATRVGGVVDLLRNGDNGYLSPPGDAQTLARQCLRIIHSGAWYNHVGREEVQRRYSARRLVADLGHLYDYLLGERDGSGN